MRECLCMPCWNNHYSKQVKFRAQEWQGTQCQGEKNSAKKKKTVTLSRDNNVYYGAGT